MIQAVITIGAILTAIIVVANIILVKMSTKESYSPYYPNIFLVIVGLLLLGVASIAPKVDLLGAGFGGWGIAALFAAAIGFVITSILDAYRNVNA
ncbi:hypothetical protein [Oceanobacillus saliphilus]|uniref:hypothetical protein n=1 Tax=Oceanobacillus saliphilus TaxID=2925834 RepID=UPI00201E0992|nr:hypothetical protein [Oceanobacillus saliphilus]